MGAWDVDTFDNDTAGDWACELQGVTDAAALQETFNMVLDIGDEYLDSDEACMGLAACEVIARLKGNWGKRDAYTENVDKWVEAHPQTPSAELVAAALRVIDRVTREPSELLELWSEAEPGDWLAAVADLRKRVEE
ncbi:MAG: DUF4259 domain-containing protein [Pirellulaceae bacterium]|jgi:hypothetical protein|nr:DUF4259 domain-containing protein [Pirellulaceae bacterium]